MANFDSCSVAINTGWFSPPYTYTCRQQKQQQEEEFVVPPNFDWNVQEEIWIWFVWPGQGVICDLPPRAAEFDYDRCVKRPCQEFGKPGRDGGR